MDITTLVISSAAGGAAGSFIKEFASNGVKWLCDLVTAQSPEMQTIVKRNMENFVVRLAQRVDRLECELPAEKAQIFQDALNHPSSALLIKTAIVDAATTDNDDRHELLAELISQRLTAEAEDMIALVGAAASGIVTCLTSRQIKLLAIMTTIKDVRTLQKYNITDRTAAKVWVNEWWQQNLDILLTDGNFSQVTQLDYEHLVALGCIRMSIASAELTNILSNGFIEPAIQFSETEFSHQKWYHMIKKQWDNLGCSTTTSVGRLIGILHRDAKLKTKTVINW